MSAESSLERGAVVRPVEHGGFPPVLKTVDTILVTVDSVLLLSIVPLLIFLRYAWAPKSNRTADMALMASLLLAWTLLGGFPLSHAQSSTNAAIPATETTTATTTSYREIFTIPAEADVGQTLLPNILDPEAVDVQTVAPGYTASNVQNSSNGFTADLDLAGSAVNVYGTDIENLTLTVEYQARGRLHVEIQPRYIGPENETWFILPEAIVPRPAASSGEGTSPDGSDFDLSWTNDPTFSFTVRRKSTGDTLFTTEGSRLVYEDQFIEFVSPLPENYNLYGLGEVIHGLRLGNNLTRTLFAADIADPIDENIYGTHPVYLDTRYFRTVDGNETYVPNATDTSIQYTAYTHGVFHRNAHAQEVLLRPEGITWRSLGGTIDLYFYSGPSAPDVIQSYQNSTVGLPAFQQYWTLGFHLCRWGYNNWTQLREVVDRLAALDIPLETIWTDIDYMYQYRNFENDPERFGYAEGAEFLSKLHANGQHYVPIVDSAIYHPNPENASDAYAPFDRGVEAGAFLLNPDEESLYIGAVWPGYTVYPDWVGAALGTTNGTGAIEWWRDEVTRWHQNISFDGIWIDMSEVSSFCVGSCGTGNLTLNPVHPSFLLPGEPGNVVYGYPEGFNSTNATEASSASSASLAQASATASGSGSASTTTSYLRTTPTPGVRNINYPPYVINNVQGDLAVHAVSPNATHHGGAQEYDFHNLFGHQILNATYHALLSALPDKRPFIIGRSTFAGSGRWAGHWGGDNTSLWAYMVFSISQALSFSIFGIPMFGADVCGFNGDSDLELCSRWMQLGAFLPFYRNHNELSAAPQEPYVWAAVASASRDAMAARYALLPYLYTLAARAHASGDTVVRALAWEFPGEPWLADAYRQFLLGPAILVTPVLEQGAATVDGVFPGAGDGVTVWYDWYGQAAVAAAAARGRNVTIDAPLGHIPVHVRGGCVVPTQQPGYTTRASRGNPWGLLVALDRQGAARGTLYLDDGESLVPNATTWVQLSASNTSVAAQPSGNFTDSNPLSNVTVMGVPGPVSGATFNGQPVADGWSWDDATKVLRFTALDRLTPNGTWNSDWELRWTLSGGSATGTSTSAATEGTGPGGGGQPTSTTATGGAAYLVVPVAGVVTMLIGVAVVVL